MRLTVYSQIVSGTNYKITFVDSKADLPIIQEYTVWVPLNLANNELDIIGHNTYKAKNKLIPTDKPSFKALEKNLHKYLKDSTEKLCYISYISPIENDETNFYLINANTGNGEHLYVICQEKRTGEYYLIRKVK